MGSELGKAVADVLTEGQGPSNRREGVLDQQSTRLTAQMLGVSLQDPATRAVGSLMDGAIGALNTWSDQKLTRIAETTDRKKVQEMLTGNDRCFYLNSKTESGLTVLHAASEKSNYNFIEVFIKTFDTTSDTDFKTMQRKDRSGRAFFHPHSQSPVDINILKLIAEGLDRNNFLQIMMIEGMNN